MKIQVTREDIQKGRRGDCYGCPLAIAISRALDRPVEVWSHQVVVLSKVETKYTVVPLPVIAQRFIAGFDINKIRPATCPGFEFELDMDRGTVIEPSHFQYED